VNSRIHLATLLMLPLILGVGESVAAVQMLGAVLDTQLTRATNVRQIRRSSQVLQFGKRGMKSASRTSRTSTTEALDFANAVLYDSGGDEASSVAVADINRDGVVDVVLANYSSDSANRANGSVAVLLGNGDGTFRPAVTYDSGGYGAASVLIADVNGDGQPDVIVANIATSYINCCNGTDGVVGVLLGNGDGTFQTAVTFDTGGIGPSSVTAADINSDGRPDLLVANNCANANCGNGVGGWKNFDSMQQYVELQRGTVRREYQQAIRKAEEMAHEETAVTQSLEEFARRDALPPASSSHSVS